MPYQLPELPFATNALAPYMSEETLNYHHGKHHATYIKKTNNLLEGTDLVDMPLIELITQGIEKLPADKRTPVFNNAAQILNHNFFWQCLRPKGDNKASKKVEDVLAQHFGNIENFKQQFNQLASNLFGSGWTWLAQDSQGKLEILPLKDADNPLTKGKKPLLTIDVWEHAYYLDYKNERARYLENIWNIINWEFIEANMNV